MPLAETPAQCENACARLEGIMRSATLTITVAVLASLMWAKDKDKDKDAVEVEVKATHAVTRDDQSFQAVNMKVMNGSHSPTKQVEVYNLDTVINGEHVALTCDDKMCESPALGTYTGEIERKKWIKLTFDLPVTHKQVSRKYTISGSW